MKPQNLLLTNSQVIKIIDFGLSNTYKKNELLKTACGSPCYAAPEMIAGKRYQGLNVDIWSCGVILYALICGYLPFEDPNTANLYKKILAGDYSIPQFVSGQARDLIKNILNTDPAQRYTISDIRAHPWFNIYQGTPLPQGIIVGYNKIPVDMEIVKQLEPHGFSLDYAQKCIEANKHNHVTTSYYLLLQQHIQNGGKSIADISSQHFDQALIMPSQRPSQTPVSTLTPNEILNNSQSIDENDKQKIVKVRNIKETAPASTQIAGTGGSSSRDQELLFNQTMTMNNNMMGKENNMLNISLDQQIDFKTNFNFRKSQQVNNNNKQEFPNILLMPNNKRTIKTPNQTNQLNYSLNNDLINNFIGGNTGTKNHTNYENNTTLSSQINQSPSPYKVVSSFHTGPNEIKGNGKFPTHPNSNTASPRTSQYRKFQMNETGKDFNLNESIISNSNEPSRQSSIGNNVLTIQSYGNQMKNFKNNTTQATPSPNISNLTNSIPNDPFLVKPSTNYSFQRPKFHFGQSNQVRHISQLTGENQIRKVSNYQRERGQSTEPFDDSNTYKIISAGADTSGFSGNSFSNSFNMNATNYMKGQASIPSNNYSYDVTNPISTAVGHRRGQSNPMNAVMNSGQAKRNGTAFVNQSLNTSINFNSTNYGNFKKGRIF